ncbi:hypothetical protein POTOM_021284 [Populus tomentosa]|uniref:Uncharacterized protein n=1 Tax=Populus tomentosa TaxID=118781 RepID=A0A8X7ZQ67_POPTO|nr:hypothetical protein POTOM_021284 [Populus tomentosa]
MFACQRIYVAIRAPFLDQERRELTEAYMEALIPEPLLLILESTAVWFLFANAIYKR